MKIYDDAAPGVGTGAAAEENIYSSQSVSSDAVKVQFTRLTSTKPQSKTFSIDNEGAIRKQASPQMTSGTAKRVALAFPEDFASALRTADRCTTFAYGLFDATKHGKSAKIGLKDTPDVKKGEAIARTRDFFAFAQNQPGIVMFDHDGGTLTPEGLDWLLEDTAPEVFDGAAYATRASVSAGVHRKGERPRSPDEPGSHHVYYAVADASDIPRFAEVLFMRLWLAGQGRIELSAAGTMLVRGPLDDAVFQPERLDFVGAPIVGKGLEYTPPSVATQQGGMVDTHRLPDLTTEEKARYQRLVDEAKAAKREEAARVRAQWRELQVCRMVESGADEEQARSSLPGIEDDGRAINLFGDFILDFDRFSAVTVKEVLGHPDKFDGQSLADPIEGVAYGTGKAKYYANQSGKPCIHSFAHGGYKYFLCEYVFENIEEGDEGRDFGSPPSSNNVHNVHHVHPNDIEAILAAALEKLPTDPGAVYEPQVIEALRAIRSSDPPRFARLWSNIKQANKDVGLGRLDEVIRRGDSNEFEEKSLSDQLVEFVKDRATLFRDPDNIPFANFPVGAHRETWRLESQGFREWLGAEFYRETKLIPKETPLKDACIALAGIAKYDGMEHDVSVRVAKTAAGYAVDLVDDGWRSVLVNGGSWYLSDAQDVMFRRATTMRALPIPLAPGMGNVDLLWDCVNCRPADRNMLLAWMLECWRSDTPFAVLELVAEQGSGKSKAQHYLRELIDPNQVNLRGRPKAVEDVYIGAANSWLTSFENLSHLSEDMQDALCVLATGGGFASRKLFTNEEESAIAVRRPVVMNGISVLATRQDLVDRLVHVEIESLTPDQRKTEADLDALFNANRAAIFTGLLDLFAAALAKLPGITLTKFPRMADFAQLGAAVYAARGVTNPAETFMRDYEGMRADAIHRTLDGSPLAAAINAFLEESPDGKDFSNVKAAMVALSEYRDIGAGDAWPRTARGFGDAIRRLSPALRTIGINIWIDRHRGKQGYAVCIKPAMGKP